MAEGCGCGKPKPAPHGSGQQGQAGSGGLASNTQSFSLRTPDGRTQSFGSLLEAQAASVRAGGGKIVPGT